MQINRNPISRKLLVPILWCLGWSLALQVGISHIDAQTRLRFYWGSTEANHWEGKIYLSDGDITNLQPLGVDDDSSCAGFLIDGRLELSQTIKSRFNGFDFEIQPSPDSFLFVEIREKNGARFRKSYSINEIIRQSVRQNIDSKKNYFQISRVPGDGINVDLQNKSAVFWTNQRFSPLVTLESLNLESNERYNAIYRLIRVSDQSVVWKQQFKHVTDENGKINDIKQVAFKLPTIAGAYLFQVEFAQQKSARISKQALIRNVELVVVRSSPLEVESKKWRKLTTVDLAETQRSDRYDPSRILRRIKNPIYHNHKTSYLKIGAAHWSQLAVGGWHVIPIDIEQPGQPHYLELHYPQHLEMAVGVSILQLPESQIERLGADSGFVNKANVQTQGQTGIHRVTFWPQAKKVFVVVVNRSRSVPATFGKIQMFAGPDQLQKTHSIAPTNTGRQFLAYYEQPFFADNFDAPKHYDKNTKQQLTDWNFFHVGANRFVDYLKYSQKTGVLLTVAADGSAIYPSPFLRPNAKYDNGVFSADGRDAERKDVLEMLFRIFDREKLQLIPVIEFSTCLPNLEKAVHQHVAPSSLQLTNPAGQFGNWKHPHTKPGYNILCPNVQNEIKKIVAELHARYSSHPSYGGVGIKLGPDTYTILPNQRWGFDRETIGQFLRDEKMGAQSIDHNTAIERITRGDLGPAWRQWRTRQVTRFYKQISDIVGKPDTNHRLYLSAVDLFRDPTINTQLMPSLRWRSNYQLAMQLMGLDIKALTADPNITFLSPRRVTVNKTLSEQRVEYQFASNSKAGKQQSASPSNGHLFVNRDDWIHYSQLEKLSPFNRNSDSLIRFQPLSLTGEQNRKRFAQSLAQSDSQLLADGGVMLTLGQEQSLVNWHHVFTQMPLQEMKTLAPEKSSPVVIRYGATSTDHRFYVVNSSPWKTRVTIQFESSADVQIKSLGNQNISTSKSASVRSIDMQLEPYDIAGGIVVAKQFKPIDFKTTLDSGIASHLQNRIARIKQKLDHVDLTTPLRSIRNSDFEYSESGKPSVWRFDANKAQNVKLSTSNSYQGRQHLELSSSGTVVWLRSNSIPPPKTGRLSLTVWLRTDDPQNQPPLRLAIQGKHHGHEYYRFANIGSLVPDGKSNQLTTRWKKYVVHFNDLPTENLTDLQIGFDLMGKGQVWLDYVQIFDRWFDEYDRKVIAQTVALASYQLVNQGDMNGCLQLLESYWPKFIETYIGNEANNKNATASPSDSEKPKTSSLLQRVRDGIPDRILKIR